MRVLVVNAGSSSLKLDLLDGDDRTVAARELSAPDAGVDDRELGEAIASGLGDADVAAHRIVHGGDRFHDAVRIDGEVEAQLRALSDLAPLHQPESLAVLDAVSAALPGVPAVACFDTAFHAGLPPAAATYALPAEWRARWPIRRYGFHGLSHAWVSRRAPALLGPGVPAARIVSCHLGAGASLCAIADGRSVDTTMGFTPLEGLVMATRSGSVDPGLLLWLLEHTPLSEREMGDALEHRSGLRGLAGTPDLREVIERAGRDDADAVLALGVLEHRLRASIAAMAAALGGLDVLVFTGGVGEHAPLVRAHAAGGLRFLGVGLDEAANEAATADADITATGAAVRTLVVTAREDLEMARQARAVVASG